jgi:hypothetical protein
VTKEAPVTPKNGDDTAPYLGYLSKEMTIMGILSTFCIAATGLVLKFSTNAPESHWLHDPLENSKELVSAGCGALVMAAYLFYRQRSMLAWHYGQISLALVPGGHPYKKGLRSLIVDADTWSTWISYRIAKNFMFFGFFEFSLIVVRANTGWQWINNRTVSLIVPICLIIVLSFINWRLMWAFEDEDSPLCEAFRHPTAFVKKNWPWNRHREDL